MSDYNYLVQCHNRRVPKSGVRKEWARYGTAPMSLDGAASVADYLNRHGCEGQCDGHRVIHARTKEVVA